MSTKLPSALKPHAATAVPEDIPMDAQQQLVYQEAKTYLQQPSSSFLAPLFAVVPITEGLPQDVATSSTASSSSAAAAAAAPEASAVAAAAAPPSSPTNRGSPFRFRGAGTSPPRWYMAGASGDDSFSTLSALRTTQPLQEALNQLEGIEKKEQALVRQSPLTKELTSVITGEHYVDAVSALVHLEDLGKPVPRRVCQHPFRKNDIVWVCRTCQADETCVLCHECFSQSNHDGHDVSFYHAQAGGCCDCGDPDAWDPKGFCPHHGPDAAAAKASSGSNALPANLVHRVRGVVPAVVDWMVHIIAANADEAYSRANPRHSTSSEPTNPSDEEEGENNLMEDDDDVTEGVVMDETIRSSFTISDRMDLDDDDEISVDELDFPTTNPNLTTPPPRTHIFSPTAASAARSHRESTDARSHHNAQLAESLGLVGSSGRGLYLVLHADDIHVKHEVVDALRYFWGTGLFFSDMLLNKIAEALRQYGQLIVWGTSEICTEIGPTQAHLWMDGDKLVSTRVGDLMLDRANRLSRHGMFCSILTYNELLLEERAVAVLQWLSAVARSCDPLCQTVAECILPNRHLVPLLRADFKMSSRATKAWYSLLLTLLAVPAFKSHLAAAYCDTYRQVTAKYARGMGVLERSGYTLSVQFLNRVAYVVDLVQGRDLLGKLGKSLLDTLLVATRTKHYNGRLDPNHFVLAHRRYSPCVSDLKCVLNVAGMPRVTACAGGTFLGDWIASLSVAQFMDPQTWRHWTQGHVEDESRGWVGAFNASISLGSLFERLLGWTDEEESPIKDSSSPLSKDLMTCVELSVHVLLKGVAPWQKTEFAMYQSTPFSSTVVPHRRCSNSLAFSTISAKCGTALAMRQIPISQMTPFSFHLPLHRFVASALRELCLRTNEVESGMTNLMQRLRSLPSSQGDSDNLFCGLMEFPVLVLSRVAQVRSDLWKRSGPGLNDQVLNYAEPPFCRNMRDADLLLTQFSVLGRVQHLSPEQRPSSDVGVAFLVNLLLHRFGIFDFVGFKLAPNSDLDRYHGEVGRGMYLSEIVAPGETETPLPWTYSAGRDPPSFMKLLEEFLHFVIVFVTELPHPVPKDRQHQTRQAKYRLFREVVHRLASGPKTHSELSEVHHVLSHWDNVLLNEQGRALNPDDATGAVLGVVLEEVADRRVVRNGRPEPDKWELRNVAWESYDPAFFHCSLRSHQTAAENRPKPKADARNGYGWDPKPFAPRPADAHPFFERLRRDVTADATVVAIAYRVLHLHCRKNTTKDLSDLYGEAIYESGERSETALARAVHLLTLGAYAWCDAQQDDSNWRDKGGGSAGSVFFDRMDGVAAPTFADWITACLLQEPRDLLDSDWYEGEENALLLLHRLATSGGASTGFMAQDTCLRSGAAWLCKFAATHCPAAAAIIAPSIGVSGSGGNDGQGETEIEKRRRLARERQQRVMASMKAQAAKFASTVSEDEKEELTPFPPVSSPHRPVRTGSFGSTMSSSSSLAAGESDSGLVPNDVSLASDVGNIDLANVPPRLMQTRPRCIICNYEESSEERAFDRDDDGEGSRKKSRRKTENALGFVGYSQASTVLKGGGGPPPDLNSLFSPLRGFVGVHVALCGHAVHSECCESYLATVSHREDRAIGKRDEFRCPLCQRLSNCLVPFIDVGIDWVDPPTCLAVIPPDSTITEGESEGNPVDSVSCGRDASTGPRSLNTYLSRTSWWLLRHTDSLVWDGQSAFIDRVTAPPAESSEDTQTRKTTRGMRSLKKKDLYAAWNAMMRTPRFVRRRLRPRASITKSEDSRSMSEISTGEDSSGETLVLRRFMDQVADISYKADGRRLDDNTLHDLFGEFRHFVTERFAYSIANTSHGGREISEWPVCMFGDTLSDTKKQEMSREKLLSKLLMSIQAFTYSCCCEGFEARRAFRRSTSQVESGRARPDYSVSAVLSRFGMSGIECDNRLIILPEPVSTGDGLQPFDGRLGKLRYLALAIVSAAGAVSADLVQLVVPFPVEVNGSSKDEHPERAPIAYPLLFGHVLTHITTAMCATCGRARAQSDCIDLWQVPISLGVFERSDMQIFSKRVDGVADDCDGFLKLGVLARTLQVLLGRLRVPDAGMSNFEEILATLRTSFVQMHSTLSSLQKRWVESCLKLLEVAFSGSRPNQQAIIMHLPGFDEFVEVCSMASDAVTSFVSDFGTILQILVPGIMARYGQEQPNVGDSDGCSTYSTFESLRVRFQLETIDEMLESDLVRQVVGNWYTSACTHATEKANGNEAENDLRRRLRRTQGFRSFDWPSAGTRDVREAKGDTHGKEKKLLPPEQPHDDSLVPPLEMGQHHSTTSLRPGKDILRHESARALVTFSSKKSVPLLGGFMSEGIDLKCSSPRVAVIPTSYTDLYAELGALLPDCEQTAVCLVCGEVLNASGKGECTRHSYKCGAGAGMFFLLQECSGLIMHKSKAAYIHSPYVDSHGETPQYRGRPLNLDLNRYDHLREIWYGHGVRQQVVAERATSRQVILPDFY